MATQSLSITRAEIKRAIARKNYWNPAALTAEQTTNLNDIIRSGERTFYYSALLPGSNKIHVWSFMRPILSLQLVADKGDYDLPEDFGGFDGALQFRDFAFDLPLIETNISHVLALRSQSQFSTVQQGQPTRFAVYPLTAEAGPAQRMGVAFYMVPDQDYWLHGVYVSNPAGIGDDTDYPLGGQPHAETLMAACLAASERIMEDAQGVDTARYYSLLAGSISWDRTHSGGRIGPVLTDGPGPRRPFDRSQFVLYNGQLDPE